MGWGDGHVLISRKSLNSQDYCKLAVGYSVVYFCFVNKSLEYIGGPNIKVNKR